ncbi:hypothetical protein POPTR_004G069101v4 [Populus trichocarpa]|uniref:Uncharacterized protein n=1 Tax=Populus trichocarpa TaxID=3694 RepID=A0ACC0T3D4_POPTR|nr:hypothetical protein POPTR_004G069101v4 [Populus trichocarpa]
MDSKRKYNQYLTIILFVTIIFVSCSNPIMAASPLGSDDHQLGDNPDQHMPRNPDKVEHYNPCRYVPGSLSRCRVGGPPV